MNDGIFIFGALVVAYVIGMIVSMVGSDKVIEDLYGLPPIDKKTLGENKNIVQTNI